jgi:hypothetical protein
VSDEADDGVGTGVVFFEEARVKFDATIPSGASNVSPGFTMTPSDGKIVS